MGINFALPFAAEVEQFFLGEEEGEGDRDVSSNTGTSAAANWENSGPLSSSSGGLESKSKVLEFVKCEMAAMKKTFMELQRDRDVHPLVFTPVLLGHGVGRRTRDILAGIGFPVQWKEQADAGEGGHWVEGPRQLVDIADFLEAVGGNWERR